MLCTLNGLYIGLICFMDRIVTDRKTKMSVLLLFFSFSFISKTQITDKTQVGWVATDFNVSSRLGFKL